MGGRCIFSPMRAFYEFPHWCELRTLKETTMRQLILTFIFLATSFSAFGATRWAFTITEAAVTGFNTNQSPQHSMVGPIGSFTSLASCNASAALANANYSYSWPTHTGVATTTSIGRRARCVELND